MCTGLPTICVELKPKWGCLPSAATIHPGNWLKRRQSKFQLQQALKMAEVSRRGQNHIGKHLAKHSEKSLFKFLLQDAHLRHHC